MNEAFGVQVDGVLRVSLVEPVEIRRLRTSAGEDVIEDDLRSPGAEGNGEQGERVVYEHGRLWRRDGCGYWNRAMMTTRRDLPQCASRGKKRSKKAKRLKVKSQKTALTADDHV